ncbi:MAG TPA: DMT family transporter [Thermomicrobiales bacterium]|nr:DMT family transporter [Thermomicrobiales bacterium]
MVDGELQVRVMIAIFVLLTLAMGATAVVQVGINSELRSLVGNPYQTALISTLVSTIFLIAVSLAVYHRPIPEGYVFREMDWWMWTGGIIGALFVAGTAALVSRLGSSVMFTLIILGQLGGAIVIDHFGWFGLDEHPITLTRVAGIALVIVGAVVVRSS